MKNIIYRAIDTKVLIVAVINEHKKGYGDWAAYIGVVPGECHDIEKENVASYGTKLDKTVAEYYFGHIIKSINNTRDEEGEEHIHWRK